MTENDGFVNPKDPLRHFQAESQRALFVKLRDASCGYTLNDVSGAAINLVVNALRKECSYRVNAERRFDEVMQRAKGLLMDHYDSQGRRLQGIFPFDQTIEAPLLIADDVIFKP